MTFSKPIGVFLGIVCFCLLLLAGWLLFSKNNFTKKQTQIPKNTEFSVLPRLSPLSATSSDTSWSLLLAGDVIPARVTNQKMVEREDFMWPLRQIKDVLKSADLTLINLEAPLIKNCPRTNEGFKFCGDARFVQSLAESGVDVANLANNHALNYGWESIGETEAHLQTVGVDTTGFTLLPSTIQGRNDFGSTSPQELKCEHEIYCSKLIIKNIQNIKLGFLGYNAVGQRIDRSRVEQEVRSADSLVDVLIVSVHWGKEYEREPQPDMNIASDDPKELGHLFVDWGADVVVGNHPHWYQRFEFISPFAKAADGQNKAGKDKIIFYALGNTVFDQEWSPETKVGFLAKLYFTGKDLVRERLEVIPIGIRDYGEAYLLEGREKETVLDFLNIP